MGPLLVFQALEVLEAGAGIENDREDGEVVGDYRDDIWQQ